MSANSGGGPGGREVAYRLFAAEYDDATVSYSESDEERAPNYVVTPTGARINRLFVVGVLTETERVGGEQIRARVVDPTGAFVAYAGQYQPDELAFLDRVEPPAFLAITGKARTFSPEDSDRVYTSVRPESISEVDAATRDRWVVRTAEQTLDRVATMASALRSGLHGEELRERLVGEGVDPGLASGVALAVEHYGTSSAYLRALRETALDAVRVVAGEKEEVERLRLAPDEGGTDDAVLAGLAGMDLAAAAPSPGLAGGESTTATRATDETSASPDGAETAGATAASTADDDAAPETSEPGTTESEPADSTTEPEPAPEPEATTTATESSTAPSERGTDADGADADESSADESASGSAAVEAEPAGSESEAETAGSDEEEFEDFEPGEFDLPEEERERVEDEFGTEFETAGEVGPAGEADIETPEPEPETEAVEESTTTESTTEVEVGETPEPEPQTEAETSVEPEPAAASDAEDVEDVDLDEVTVEAITELDGGDGADREEVVSTVAERHGFDPEDVADAIESAMMSGRAYEPSDGRLKAI